MSDDSNNSDNPFSGILSFIMSPIMMLMGLFGMGNSDQNASQNSSDGGNFFTNILKMLGLGGNTDVSSQNNPTLQAQQPSGDNKPNFFENAWSGIKQVASNTVHAVKGFFGQHPDELARDTENGKVAAYIQADKLVNGQGALGHLVLIDDEGHKETFNFKSGPWQNGALPGLLDTKNLTQANNNNANAPVTSYTLGNIDHDKSDHRYCTTDGQTGFWVQLNNDALNGRGGFGIHPNRNGASGDQVGTLGCIGLDDESAKRFDVILKDLQARGVMIQKLDVFAPTQNAEVIEQSKLHSTPNLAVKADNKVHGAS